MARKQVEPEAARPLRICDVCGQIDDHPRHVYVASDIPVNQAHVEAVLERDDIPADVRARIIAEVLDTTVQQRHPDCCAAAGCPASGTDADCAHLAVTGLTGSALVEHITGG